MLASLSSHAVPSSPFARAILLLPSLFFSLSLSLCFHLCGFFFASAPLGRFGPREDTYTTKPRMGKLFGGYRVMTGATASHALHSLHSRVFWTSPYFWRSL